MMIFRKITHILCLFVCSVSPVFAQSNVKIYKLENYGILPNTGKNNSAALATVLKTIKDETKKEDKVIIRFRKGRYDFYPAGAAERTYYISNHDQSNPKLVGIELANFDNITLDGNGADLLFHGRMLPLAILDSKNVTIKNISIDFEKPQIAQVKVVDNDTLAGHITFETAPWVSYKIKDSTFYNLGEGWEMQPTSGIAFENDTKHILYHSGDISVGTKSVSEISPGIIKAHHWKNKKLVPGTVIAMRSWYRPAPGIFVHKGKDIYFNNVKVHYAEGMGLLAQLTENIFMDGFGVCLRGKNDERYFTTQADATHFSGCKGAIVSKNGLYEGMMDDAINIHGTYLKGLKRLNDSTLIASYMHGQSYGFNWGYKGDTVQFIRAKTMELWDNKYIISSISPLHHDKPIKEFKIVFTKRLAEDIDPAKAAMGVENLSWTPSVVFTGNTIRNNRARGALFSTPKYTLVADNLFDHTSGSAIVLCGDSNGWYETGACKDVTIRNNKFVNALTSMYQFTNGVISIYPEIPDLAAQSKYFHSGIKITDNQFESFDHPILYAKSVDGILFKNNKINTNSDYPAFHKNKKRVLFHRVIGVAFSGNKVNGKLVDLLAK